MLTNTDISNVRYSKLDGNDVTVLALTRCFTSVREELLITVAPLDDVNSLNRELVMGFSRDGEDFELSAFVILQEIEYVPAMVYCVKALRFASLGGYTVAPVDKEKD